MPVISSLCDPDEWLLETTIQRFFVLYVKQKRTSVMTAKCFMLNINPYVKKKLGPDYFTRLIKEGKQGIITNIH